MEVFPGSGNLGAVDCDRLATPTSETTIEALPGHDSSGTLLQDDEAEVGADLELSVRFHLAPVYCVTI
jgi:hypothetical protein